MYLQCEFIKSSNYGGAMIWAMGTDDHNGLACNGVAHPLLSIISTCLGVSVNPTPDPYQTNPPPQPGSTTTTGPTSQCSSKCFV